MLVFNVYWTFLLGRSELLHADYFNASQVYTPVFLSKLIVTV